MSPVYNDLLALLVKCRDHLALPFSDTDKQDADRSQLLLEIDDAVARAPVVNKVAYVHGQSQSRNHECHWPGCELQVPPAMWGCRQHWFALPKALRDKVWRTYRPGQEKDCSPSDAYIAVAKEVRSWIETNGGGK